MRASSTSMQTVSHERHLCVTMLSPVFAISYNDTTEGRGRGLERFHNLLAGQLAVWYVPGSCTCGPFRGVADAGPPQGSDRSSLRGL